MKKFYFYLNNANADMVEDLIIKTIRKAMYSENKNGFNIDDYTNDEIVDAILSDCSYKFVFCLTKNDALSDDVYEKINKIIFEMQKFGCKNENIIFSVLDNTHEFDNDEWVKILKLNKFLQEQEIKFGFEDHGKTFSLLQVKRANNKIKKMAEKINSNEFSPLEKILTAYFMVTKRKYNEEKKNESLADSRSVYSVLNTNKIVCVGYSELMQAILDLTKDENIKVYQNGVQIIQNKIGAFFGFDNLYASGHRNLVIYVKDKKYNLDGYYYVDPTWDCSKYNNILEYNLNNFMIPLNDIEKYRRHIRADYMFLHLPQFMKWGLTAKNKPKTNKEREIEYATLLNDIDNAKYAERDDNNVSISRDAYHFDGSFLNDFLKHKMHFNTANDFKEITVDAILDNLNELIDKNKDIKSNLKFIKDELIAHNVDCLTSSEIMAIVKSDNYVDTLVDIIINSSKRVKNPIKTLDIPSALVKLTTILNNEQVKLEKYAEDYMNFKLKDKYPVDDFDFYKIPIVEKTMKYLSTPIALNKLKSALRQYLTKVEMLSVEEANIKIKKILKQNISSALDIFNCEAENAIMSENYKLLY